MDYSRLVSEFSLRDKPLPPTTATRSPLPEPPTCQHCPQLLSKISALSKQEIQLELRIEQLKEQLERKDREVEELRGLHLMTYEEYGKKMETDGLSTWNKEDL
jgi:hypothetical protein